MTATIAAAPQEPRLAGHPVMAWHMIRRDGQVHATVPCDRACTAEGTHPHWVTKATGPTIAAVLETLRGMEGTSAHSTVILPGPSPEPGAEGFYVTIQRRARLGVRTGFLLGPYDTKEEAEGMVFTGRRLARQADDRATWDAFGVTRLVARPGETLRPGVLNGGLAAERAG